MAVESALAVTAVAAVAGAGATYVSSQNQAKAAARAAAIEQEQYASEQKAAQLRAEQEQAAVQEQMRRAQSASEALRAGRGLDAFSVTGRALLAANEDDAAADLETLKANAGLVQNRNMLGAQASTNRANSAISTANSNAAGAIIGGFSSVGKAGYGYMSRASTTPRTGADL